MFNHIGLNTYFMLYDINGYGGIIWSNPLTNPLFLAKGPSGEIFVRDNQKNRLVTFKNNGGKLEYSTYFAGEGYGRGYFKNITGIAASKDYLYVADCHLDCIQKLHIENGKYANITLGSHGSEDGQLDSPYGLALDEDNSLLYVCDLSNNRIQIFKNDFFLKIFEGSDYFQGPLDVTLNNDKDLLFVTDSSNNIVQVFKTNGEHLRVIGAGVLSWPTGVCYKDSFVIVSCNNDKVYMFDAEGRHHELPGPFSNPWGVVMLDDKQIVVANHDSNKLTVVVGI